MKSNLSRLACLSGLLALPFTPLTAGTPKIKNVVLILTDDMGYHLSGIGTPGISTPNADRLMREGVLFSNAFSACASSAPSRSSILTGMYPHSNGHWRNTHTLLMNSPSEDFEAETPMRDVVGVHEWVQTLPEILGKEGYYTAIMHKYHLSYPWKYRFSSMYNTPTTPEAYKKDVLKIVENADGKPFFIMANIAAPHRPWPAHVRQFKGKRPTADQIEVPGYLPDLDSVRADLLNYYISVMYADQVAGGVLDAIRESGQEDETLIIFTSDQGPAFHRAKASPFYEGSHIPMIIKGKGVRKGVISDELVSLTDLLPTILDGYGLPVPEQVQGASLLPLAQGDVPQIEDRDYIFTTHNSHGPIWSDFYPSRAIFDGKYYLIRNLMPEKTYGLPTDLEKSGTPWYNTTYDAIVANREQCPEHYRLLIETLCNRPPYELYDMESDPFQMKNRYGDPHCEEARLRLENRLEEWRKATGDTPELIREMTESFQKPVPFILETQRRNQTKKN